MSGPTESGAGPHAGTRGGAGGSMQEQARRGVLSRVAGWVATPGAGVFLLGAALAFGVLGASDKIGLALRTMKQENVIRVKGVAELDVTSDRGSWWTSVSGRATTLAEADASRESAMAALRAFVEAKGFTADELTTGSVSISKVYKRDEKGNTTNTLEEYVLSQSLGVRSSKLEVIRTAATEVTGALVKLGFEASTGTPNFTVSTIEKTKLELLEKATANAYERAQTLARGSGSTVGGLVSASQGVYQIVSRGSSSSSDYGEYDTDAIDKTARVVVTLEYAVR
ncbi:MAG: SIMPL domain-containing protein [Phycisphaerales bacterium]